MEFIGLDRYEVVEPPPGLVEPCWLWRGGLNGKGYGPHRASYEANRGPIPPGHVLDHLCRRRSCINPAHLEPVTQSENELRKPTAGRVARGAMCPRGHALVGANRVSGGECRRCNTRS